VDAVVTDGANLVLVRHGESEWNARGLATGWADVALTARGRRQAAAAGRQLASEGQEVDIAFTSVLVRARETTEHLLDAWGHKTIPVLELWRLNERHLGQLQGLEKQAIKARWGNAARHRWRSELEALPPPLARDDPRHPRNDPRFGTLPQELLPGSERIADLRRRVLGVWRTELAPTLAGGRRVVVVAHRDSLRVLIAELERIDDAQFSEIGVPAGVPRSYRVSGTALSGGSSSSALCPASYLSLNRALDARTIERSTTRTPGPRA
jgi:2,3-bisphosphoglycerate-dependent phosphoglycerate mutase